jgi:hypothetical protein
MAYYLERFGTQELPLYNVTHDLDVVAAKNTIVRTVLNGFDSAGSGQADQNLPQAIRYKGVILESTVSAWRTAVDALRATARTRAQLWRRAEDNDEVQWCYARFISGQTTRDANRPPFEYEASLQFMQLSPWVGHDYTTWVLDEGDYLDTALYLDEEGWTFTLSTSPKACTVTNGGNRSTNNVRLAVTAGSASITSITFACGDAEFTYSGTVASGHILVIDCGAQSVSNTTSDYANFALTSNHTIEDWIRLDPGDNIITVTKTGGGTTSSLSVEYQDGWE